MLNFRMSHCHGCERFCMLDEEGRCNNCGSRNVAPMISIATPFTVPASPMNIPRCKEPDYPPGGSYQSPANAFQPIVFGPARRSGAIGLLSQMLQDQNRGDTLEREADFVMGSGALGLLGHMMQDQNRRGTFDREEMDMALQESFAMTRSPSPKPADNSVWDWMKKDKYISLGTSPSATACSICMEDFSAQDDIVRTQCCGGITHHTCMESTLCVTPRCPFCRSESFAPTGFQSQVKIAAKQSDIRASTSLPK